MTEATRPCFAVGRMIANGRRGCRVPSSRTRRIYSEYYGKVVPKGHQLHHACGHPWCCEPTHLECLTPEQHRLTHKVQRTRLWAGFNETTQ